MSSAPGSVFPSHTSPQSPNSTTPANVSVPNTSIPSPIRGVNIGGWLILEEWMNPDIFSSTDAVDQWTFDEIANANASLHEHWLTYFTEADVNKIASWGINALRIPIGYWAYNNTETPYIKGTDWYLEQAIGWARNAGLKVLVDCHGSPGSQNVSCYTLNLLTATDNPQGFDNSGHEGNVSWQSVPNLETSIKVLETMTEKYGSMEYADVVFGIELVNEPISWDQNNFTTTQTWAQEAYKAVKSKATNENLMVIMHDGFMGPASWEQVGAALNGNATKSQAKFAIDVHLYQNQVALDSTLTQPQHIEMACNWTQSEFLPASSPLPVIVGEFSAQTNICANPDGSTVAGSICYESGCQCSANVNITEWKEPLIQATRKFVEAEMEAFEHSSAGWFIWSYKGPGVWGLDNAIKYGVMGPKVTDRKYPNQCNFTSSSRT